MALEGKLTGVSLLWHELERGVYCSGEREFGHPQIVKKELVDALGVDNDEEIYHTLRIDPESVTRVLGKIFMLQGATVTPEDIDLVCARIRKAYGSEISRLESALYDINCVQLIPVVRMLGLTQLDVFLLFLHCLLNQAEEISITRIKEAVQIANAASLADVQVYEQDFQDGQQQSDKQLPRTNGVENGSIASACLNATKRRRMSDVFPDDAVHTLCERSYLRRILRLLESRFALSEACAVPKRRVACQVHRLIEFPKWIFESVIDTPEFQRLRRIKQLGGCSYVYPGARHTRLEHSLGVGYLAANFWTSLLQASNLNPHDREMRHLGSCLSIAGLCHDLGHGPFSHTFEQMFVNDKRSQGLWRHEDMSIRLLEGICDATESISDDDKRCIKRLIQGDVGSSTVDFCDDPVVSVRRAMYSIIANRKCGVDVDRIDYLLRDVRVADNLPRFQANRIMEFARVIDGEICFSVKEVRNVLDMFTTRFRLFQEVYMHRKARAVESMICDIFEALDPVLDIRSRIDDPEEFLTLDDSLFDTGVRFMRSSHAYQCDPDATAAISTASKILDRLDRRDIYSFGGELSVVGTYEDVKRIRSNFTKEKLLACQPLTAGGCLTEADVILDWSECHHGTGRRNPVELVAFFNPADVTKKLYIQHEFHRSWFSSFPRVYCRQKDKTEQLKQSFTTWQHQYVPKDNRSIVVDGSVMKEPARSSLKSRFSLLQHHSSKLMFQRCSF